MLNQLDNWMRGFLAKWGTTLLRISLSVVFVWFGLLKIFGVSPVEELVNSSFGFLPFEFPFKYLGVMEVAIGLGLLFKVALRTTLGLMWLMLIGTFTAVFFNPTLFFSGNIFLLTTEGEFVIKNLVLLSAGMVIGAFEVRPRK
ncbi:MAG TPA: DoxX family membrane protein [Candidatus Binatia bacterium]|nr:DoxX family membrane protein [Candidatus Binatia bacterium]